MMSTSLRGSGAWRDSRQLDDKLWSHCDVLRDDGTGVIEYTEQLAYLIVPKMAHERATRKLSRRQIVPDEYSWLRLIVGLIDKENWSGPGTGIKGDAYAELLSKGACDKGYTGAGIGIITPAVGHNPCHRRPGPQPAHQRATSTRRARQRPPFMLAPAATERSS